MRFKLKPPKIFFGWWIVLASLLIATYTSGIVLQGFTAIFEPIAKEFGWSYTQISLATSIRGVEVGFLAPLVGILVDRWGPRRIIFGGLLFLALGLLLLGHTNSLVTFYAAFILVSIGMSAVGSTGLMTTIAHWFRKKISIAVGIVACGWGLGGLMIPLLVWLIDRYQWRPTMLILAAGLVVLILPLTLLERHKPEQYGYLPDGEAAAAPPPPGSVPVQTEAVDINIGVRQALKSRTTWHLGVVSMLHLMILAGILTHIMPFLSSVGINRGTASLAATAFPLSSIAGRLGAGWLGDKMDKRLLRSITFFMVALGLVCFQYVSPSRLWLLVPFVLLAGIGYGSNNPLRTAMVREFFGRSKFATIHGFIVSIGMVGNMVGAPLVGWVYDTGGSYGSIWLILAGVALVGTVVMATTPLVNRPQPVLETVT